MKENNANHKIQKVSYRSNPSSELTFPSSRPEKEPLIGNTGADQLDLRNKIASNGAKRSVKESHVSSVLSEAKVLYPYRYLVLVSFILGAGSSGFS